MATIKVPSNVTSITFSASGEKAPEDGLITELTAAEGTAFSAQGSYNSGNRLGPCKLVRTNSNGDCVLSLPALITSITIDGTAYSVTGAVTPWGKELTGAVPAVAATIVLNENFSLVQG